MPTTHHPNIESYAWHEIRERIASVNQALAEVIDQLTVDSSYRLYVMKYQYGDMISKNMRLHLPIYTRHHAQVMLDDDLVPVELQHALSYNQLRAPVGMPLTKQAEYYFPYQDARTAPFGMLRPGHLAFMTWLFEHTEQTLPYPLVDLSAGARSVYLIPKVSNQAGHHQLTKHFGIKAREPEDVYQQWPVFRDLAHSKNFAEPWNLEMVFFGAEWFSKLEDSSYAWQAWRDYLLHHALLNIRQMRYQVFWNSVFAQVRVAVNARVSANVSESVKHLFAILTGCAPGLVPVKDSTTLPIQGIQSAYVDVYKALRHEPIMMQPTPINLFAGREEQSLYYSFAHPVMPDFWPRKSEGYSLISDLSEVAFLLPRFIKQAVKQLEPIPEYHYLIERLEAAQFDFYHSATDRHADIKGTEEILTDDPGFNDIAYASPKLDRLKFPDSGSFIKGCVRISRKST